MAESSSAYASTSSAANSDYDVFINHHGPDIKKGFGSHLYHRLLSHGLKVYLDQAELNPGDFLPHEIRDAIGSASVHVAIFSPGYCDSSRCLQELVLMMESRWKSNVSIIPVFYGVQPSELRWPRGKYAEAQEKHARKTNRMGTSTTPNTIEKWKVALSDAANLSGFDLRTYNGDQGKLSDKVVKSVLRKVPPQYMVVTKYAVGLDEKVRDFEKIVYSENQSSAKPQVVGIVGLGGVGKTTLAKKFFNRRMGHYSKFCFLCNVRESARKGILNSLQRQLLQNLTGTDVVINSIDEGIAALKKHLTPYRVFVILDDVDHLNQINALLPFRTDLSDSLVVITSRDEKVIRSSGVENASIYQLTGLNDQHSRELLCAYAFNQSNPVEGFESLVDNFLEACEGLPLFLKVFGALLFGKDDKCDWKDVLDKLQQVLPDETKEKFQISYQSLDMEQQQIFLDCACFFIGQKRDTAIRIWEGSGWEGRLGFQTLEDRCLLGVDSENNIEMHDHLRDFGKAVADASLPRRLLHSTTIKDILEQFSIKDILKQFSNGPVPSVRGIRMVPGEYNDEVDASGGIDKRTLELVDALNGIDMRTLELVDTENVILERILRKPMHVPSLIWLRWNKCPNLSLPSWIPMESLRVLQVSGSELKTLWEDESQAPLQLQELEINAPLSNIPKSIGLLKHLERIVVGRFLSGHVHLTKLPEEFFHLRSLRDLVLTECSKMKSLPDSFECLSNLQHIDLSFCCNLERLPDSIGYLGDLGHINLQYCHDLVRLPDSIGYLLRLQHIDLRGCHNLESLPDSFGKLWDLRHINLSGCHDLQSLPDSFCNLIYLQHIDLQGCHNLQWLPDDVGDLMNLEHVNLSNCHDLEWLPASFVLLTNLQYIDLSGCHNLERLPNDLRNLNKLKYLDVEGCSNLIIETIEISDSLSEAHQRHLEQLYLSDA